MLSVYLGVGLVLAVLLQRDDSLKLGRSPILGLRHADFLEGDQVTRMTETQPRVQLLTG